MLKIFLSSTYRDLAEYRSKILDKLNSAFNGVGMEQFIPDGSNSQEVCIGKLKENDVIIFLISPYYGSLMDNCSLKQDCRAECPMKTETGKISYTHCEYKTTIAEVILHQTYLVGKGWDNPDVKKEALQFREEIGKEYLGFVDIEDSTLVQHLCNNLAAKLIEWHTHDKLNFKKFIDREEVLNEIIDNIDNKIEVWGVGGVGKTALVEVALLVEKLKGRKIATIGTTKSYKSGSGFKDFRKKCVEDQYVTESQKNITIYDVVKALEKVKLIPNAEELISSLHQKDKIRNFLSKFLNERKNFILFIDDFHLATKDVEDLVCSLENAILSSRKNSNIAEKEIYISGIEEKDREDLIKLFNPNIPEQAKGLIKTFAEGHPVATELLVKNYQKINFDQIKGFELVDADDKQVEDFYERVIEEIFSDNPQALVLLKNLAAINTDLPTNINRESVLNAYDIENIRKIFNSLIDTGMLKKREGKEGTYEFYFKHIQDVLEDNAVEENHRRALAYYLKKHAILGRNISDEVEILYHKLHLGVYLCSNDIGEDQILKKISSIGEIIHPVHYGYKRLIEVLDLVHSSYWREDIKAGILLWKGMLYTGLGMFEEGEQVSQEALEIYRGMDEFYVGRGTLIAESQNLLGYSYRNLRRYKKAEHAHQEALKIHKEWIFTDTGRQRVARTQNNLGLLYAELKRFEEANYAYTEALEISKKLAEKNPDIYNADVASIQNNLALLYLELKMFNEAYYTYTEALEIRKKSAEKDPDEFNPLVAETQDNLGTLYLEFRWLEEAEHAYKEALEIRRELAEKNPNLYKSVFADTQNNLGLLYTELERFEEAEHAYSEALEIRSELAEKNPNLYNPALADTQNNLGTLYQKLGRLGEAEHAYTKALEIRKKFAVKYPNIYNPAFADTQNNLGALYQKLGRLGEAEHAYTKALEIRKKFAVKYPKVYNPAFADTQINLGTLYRKLGRLGEAEHAYTKALEIRRELAEKNPDIYKKDVAKTLLKFVVLYAELGRTEDAEHAITKLLEIKRILAEKNPDLYNSVFAEIQFILGNFYLKLGRLEEAEKLYSEILATNPNNNHAWYYKACIESLRENTEKSITFLKKAIDLDKNNIEMAKNDENFNNIRNSREFKELIGE